MRYIKFIACLFLLLCISSPLTVSAHSGRTDSSGGHTDHDTGRYHYHHGFSAHSHYDMDGDGDIDCPYTFSYSNGTVPKNDYSNETTEDPAFDFSYLETYDWNFDYKFEPPTPYVSVPSSFSTTSKEKIEVANENDNTPDGTSTPTWVYWIFAIQFIIALVLFIANRSKKRDIENMAHGHKFDILSIKQSYDKKLAEKNATDKELEKLHSRVSNAKDEYKELREKLAYERTELEKTKLIRSRVKNAPLDILFTEDGMPIYWKAHTQKPYGDYTVYINKKTGIYHVDRHCAPHYSIETHIFHVIKHNRPCRKCAEGFFDFDEVPEWFFMEHTQEVGT